MSEKNSLTLKKRCPLKREYHWQLSEADFYPPIDNRVLKSNIEDIDGGDNFSDYCEYIFELLEQEDYWN